MTKEQAIKLAWKSKLIPAVVSGPSSEYFRYIEEYTKLVRNAALEEEIDACNVEASAAEHAANSQAEYGADCCACAIRNLKEPTP